MVYIKHSPGRPRLQRQATDKGIPELQCKRNLLSEGDPALAESLLGVLYARKLISRPLYEAGCFFGELGYRYKPCLGHAFRNRNHRLTPQFGGGPQERDTYLTDLEEAKRTKAWRRAVSVLQETGVASQRAVLNVVFYDQDLYQGSLLFSRSKYIKNLQKGLGQLSLYFKGELRDTVNKPLDQEEIPRQSTTFLPFLELRRLSVPPERPELGHHAL